MKKYVLVLISILAALSCSSSGDELSDRRKGGGTRSYVIDGFRDVSKVDFYMENPMSANVALKGEKTPHVHMIWRGDLIPEDEAKRLRKELGDYGGEYSDAEGGIVVRVNSFTGIDVTSDTLFNDVKPGESLGDIVVLNWLSAAPTIEAKNNYIFKPKPYSKLIRDITEADLFLIQDGFYLIFTETPSIKEHSITVSFMDKDTTITGTGHFVFK